MKRELKDVLSWTPRAFDVLYEESHEERIESQRRIHLGREAKAIRIS